MITERLDRQAGGRDLHQHLARARFGDAYCIELKRFVLGKGRTGADARNRAALKLINTEFPVFCGQANSSAR